MADYSNRSDRDEKTTFDKPWPTPSGNEPQRSDADIKKDIEDAFFHHPDVRSFEVQVEVVNGAVTLSGTVDDDVVRMVCEDLARKTPGVREVRNNLQVKGPVKG